MRWIKPLVFLTAISMTSGAQPQTSPSLPQPTTLRVDYVTPLPVQPSSRMDAVIFYDDFAQPTDLHARYFDYDDAKGGFIWDADGGYGGQGGAMKCQFEKGQVSAGSLKFLFGKNPFGRGLRSQETFREIYWRVYVRHEAGWEGNPAKLARATCLAGADWSQGFIAHVWGGKGDVLCIDPATGIRDSHKVTTRYNDFERLRWLGLRQGHIPLFNPSESGRWVCIESHIRLNSPGKQDGGFELWVDGHREASRTDLDWQGVWDEYAINAVFLENYWNDGSSKRQARWFDDFVVSTHPVGPIVTTTNPTLTRTVSPVAAWQVQVAADEEGGAIVWASHVVKGSESHLRVDEKQGVFQGSRTGKSALAADVTHWLQVRQRAASGAWTAWTAWHSPFHTSQ